MKFLLCSAILPYVIVAWSASLSSPNSVIKGSNSYTNQLIKRHTVTNTKIEVWLGLDSWPSPGSVAVLVVFSMVLKIVLHCTDWQHKKIDILTFRLFVFCQINLSFALASGKSGPKSKLKLQSRPILLNNPISSVYILAFNCARLRKLAVRLVWILLSIWSCTYRQTRPSHRRQKNQIEMTGTLTNLGTWRLIWERGKAVGLGTRSTKSDCHHMLRVYAIEQII